MSVDVLAKLNGKHAVHGKNANSDAVSVRTLSLTRVFSANRFSSLLKFNTNRNGNIAVDNLNLQVPRGAIYGYLGPNGAGKTTTIKMLVGLLRPTRGTASICGHTIHDDLQRAQQHVGRDVNGAMNLAVRGRYAGTAGLLLTLLVFGNSQLQPVTLSEYLRGAVTRALNRQLLPQRRQRA